MQNTYNSTGTTKICTVIAVDIKRSVCKCTSDSGEILSEVRWVVPMGGTDGTGQSANPIEKSRVLVDTSSGFPFIIGAIPTESEQLVRRQNVGTQIVEEEDVADYSTVDMGDIVRGPGTPRDQRVGDNVLTSDGGGLMGLLLSGTAVIKSSPLAQLIFSRFGDLLRIVSRNFEHYTDVDSTHKTSIRGKIYSMRDVFRSPDRSRPAVTRDAETGLIIPPEEPFVPQPTIVSYEGDVMWGETIGWDYAAYTADTFPTAPLIPEDALVIRKSYTYTYDPDGVQELTSTETLSDDGARYRKTQLPDDTVHMQEAESNAELKRTATGTVGIATWTFNETTNTVDARAPDGSTFATLAINSDGTITLDTSGNFVANVGGTTDWTSTGNITMTAPEIHLNN